MKIPERLKSPVVIISFAALILFILQNWGILPKLGLNVESFNHMVDLIIAFLVSVGIINNPTDKSGF